MTFVVYFCMLRYLAFIVLLRCSLYLILFLLTSSNQFFLHCTPCCLNNGLAPFPFVLYPTVHIMFLFSISVLFLYLFFYFILDPLIPSYQKLVFCKTQKSSLSFIAVFLQKNYIRLNYKLMLL